MHKRSYRLIPAGDHPHRYSDGRAKEHILIVEKILGRSLSHHNVVHHIDGNPGHNANNNLVACEDAAYHNLLHLRARALRDSGNANNRWCSICKMWDNSKNIISIGSNTTAHHECRKQRDRERYALNTELWKIKNARNYAIRKGIQEKSISI